MVHFDYLILDELKEIQLVNGKKFYMYEDYTFRFALRTRYGQRWRCSVGCKAYIMVTEKGQFIAAKGEHNHKPQNYVRVSSGLYCKVK